MATYQYTVMSDFVAYQLLQYLHMNYIRENLRYVAEDILGNPAGNSDMVAQITMDGTPSDGGIIYFDGGTSKYLRAETSSDLLTLAGMDFKVEGTKVIQGDTQIFTAHSQGQTLGSDYFVMTGSGSIPISWTMPRAGSILGYGFSVLTTSFTSAAVVRLLVDKNLLGSPVVTGANVALAANNTVYTDYATFTRGAKTFAADDSLDPVFDHVSGTYSARSAVMMIVIYDT